MIVVVNAQEHVSRRRFLQLEITAQPDVGALVRRADRLLPERPQLGAESTEAFLPTPHTHVHAGLEPVLRRLLGGEAPGLPFLLGSRQDLAQSFDLAPLS